MLFSSPLLKALSLNYQNSVYSLFGMIYLSTGTLVKAKLFFAGLTGEHIFS